MKKINCQKFIIQEINNIKKKTAGKRVLVATSGGVDSFTSLVLGHTAIGGNLCAVFIDDGLMRKDEPERVKRIAKKIGINLKIKRKSKDFFKSLKGLSDPEKKRIAFRETFYKTLGSEIRREKCYFLIQGTIAADVVETKKGIKTQHNVLAQIGINPQKYGFEVIEPLKQLYKSQVRQIAFALKLPQGIYSRMPFPGPGLALRIIGEVTPRKVALIREATGIVEKRIGKFSPFQTLAILLNDRATGIKKGKRVFGNIIAIRSVESQNALKAQPSEIPLSVLFSLQKEICKKIPAVTKVLYDLTPKPPSTIEYV